MQDYTHSYHYTATQHLIAHANLYGTEQKENCNSAQLHTGALQVSESLSPAFETKEPPNTNSRHFWYAGLLCMYVYIYICIKNVKWQLLGA